MPDPCTPEYERILAKRGALPPYRPARSPLDHFLPLGDAPEVETIRQRTIRVGNRLARRQVRYVHGRNSPNSSPLFTRYGHSSGVRTPACGSMQPLQLLAGARSKRIAEGLDRWLFA
jgi:hypothetical protein